MQTTMELLSRALEKQNAARWADELDLSDSALTQAKKRHRLSPTIAGNMAAALGEDPEHWITIAALEAEPESTAKQTLLKRLTRQVRKLYVSAHTTLRRARKNAAS